jgi:predicted O-linked N-acetylglucosamine transferase (SPINDLY family)
VLLVLHNSAQDEHSNRLQGSVQRVVKVDASQPKMLDNVLRARKQIAAENLDVLVFPELGIDQLTYFIAHARVAKVQVVFWGHPVTPGLRDSVDFFVSSRLFERGWEPRRDGRKYSEPVFLMKGLTVLFPRPPPAHYAADAVARRELVAPFARGAAAAAAGGELAHLRVYVCMQTPYKFHPLMDRALVDLTLADPKGLLVLVESRQREWAHRVKARLVARAATAADRQALTERVLVLPQMPVTKFLSLLRAADCVLDTFPFGGGVSHFEALSVGAPVIVFQHNIPWIPQYALGIYSWIFAPGSAPGQLLADEERAANVEAHSMLVARSVEKYVENALLVAQDPALRAKLRSTIALAVERTGLFHDEGRTDNVKPLLDDWKALLACATTKPRRD